VSPDRARVPIITRKPIPAGADLQSVPGCGGEIDPIKVRSFLDKDPVSALLDDSDVDASQPAPDDPRRSIDQRPARAEGQ
jgi:hypothetical protein